MEQKTDVDSYNRQLIFKHKIDLTVISDSGNTALMAACIGVAKFKVFKPDAFKIIKMLLDRDEVRSNINHVNNDGKTAIAIANDTIFDIACNELRKYGAIL